MPTKGYGCTYYDTIYYSPLDLPESDDTTEQKLIKDNILLMRDLLINIIIKVPSQEEIFKYNNNNEYIPIIDKSVTKVTYEKRNKDIIYDYMMSYHENKYLCWFLYCIIINIYNKIDDINIQGGFIRNMFEHMRIKKSSIDIDMYLLSEFLIMQKEFIMIDFQLDLQNKSCWASLPAYMNFIDSTVCILNKIINENTNIINYIKDISVYDRTGLYPDPNNHSISVTYILKCNNDKDFELSFVMNVKSYSALSHNIEQIKNFNLISYYENAKINNINNIDYLQN